MFYHHHPHVSINNHGGGDERLILEKIYPCKIEWSMVTPFMVKKTFVEQSSFLMSNSSTDIILLMKVVGNRATHFFNHF